MPETIESFIAKLQQDGVQAGQQAAKKLLDDARRQADQALADARRQAEEIVEGARREAQDLRARGDSELALAARDAVLRLQEALSRALRAVLDRACGEKLADVEFLGRVLHDIVIAYTQADLQGAQQIRINVPTDVRDKLVDWAMREIGRDKVEGVRAAIDLKGALKGAGFEYTVERGTVEVTLESVVETLAGLIGPQLRELVERAAGGAGGEKAS